MTQTEDKTVDREAWRRLLDGEGEGPPELTDARIRAKARHAITPRTGRWLLPASLAASMLLAVVLVQQQYQTGAPATVAESDYAVVPAVAPAPVLHDEPAPEAFVLDATDPRLEERSLARASEDRPDAQGAAAREQELSAYVPPPAVLPPQIDLPVTEDARVAQPALPASAPAADSAPANAAKRGEDVSEIRVTGSRIREDNLEAATPVTQVTAADVTNQRSHGALGGLVKSTAVERTPEEWYADIEELRKAGKKREAKRELEKLEKAHPGWLEQHLKQEPPKE